MDFDHFRKVGELKIDDAYFTDELKDAFESSGLKLCRVESTFLTTTYIVMEELTNENT